MAVAAVPIAVAGLALQTYGAIQAYRDSKEIAGRKRAFAQFDANMLEQQAGQEIAASQRVAFNEDRQSKLVQSRALALAAASGGSATDPTVLRIISGIASEGAYRQNVALYQGEEKARQMRLTAEAERITGEISARSSESQGRSILTQTAGSMFGQAASLYGRYGYDSPATRATQNAGASPYLDAGTPAASNYG